MSGGTSTAPVAVSYTVGGTATSGTDYTAPSGTLTLTAGAASGTFTIATRSDSVLDAGETLLVTLTTATTTSGSVTASSTAVETTIVDAGTVTVSVVSDGAVEEGEPSTFTVSLSGTVSSVVEVGWSTSDGTATAGSGYSGVSSGTLTFAASATASQTVTVATREDELGEGPETFTVTLSGSGLPAGVSLGTASATGTITDDDPLSTAVTLSLSSSSVDEGAGPTTVEVTAELNESARPEAVTVTLARESAGAVRGTESFTFRPTDDNVSEGPETLQVTGTTPGSGLTVTAAELTITDDDSAATEVGLTLMPSTVREDAGATEVEVTATLAGAARPAETVLTVSVAGDTADAADFAAVNAFELTIAATEVTGTATFTLIPADDNVSEGPETLAVTGTTAVSGLSVTPAELTLTDDDSAATEVSLSLNPSTVSEGSGATSVEVTARLNGAARPELTEVTVSVAGDTADADDFEAVSDFTVTIAAEEAAGTATFTLTPKDDTVAEDTETLSVTGTTYVSGLSVTPAELTLTDNDSAATEVGLTLSPSSVSEDAGATEVEVTATLAGAARSAATVLTVSVSGDTADAADFAAVNAFELTIAATEPTGTATFVLTPVDDELAEDAETVSVTGTTDVAGLTVTPAQLTLTDDDSTSRGITLAVEPKQVMEDAGPVEVTSRATLDTGARESPTMVQVTVDEDEDEDVVAPAMFELEIPAGEASVDEKFMLTPVDDEEQEDDRRVAVTGTNGPAGIPVRATVLTIVDDEESNRPPKFDQKRYTFDLSENRSGREAPVVLGTVGARDSDGDGIRYALFNGDRERFTVSRGSGTVSYIGEGEDFESGPSQFELQVTAKDSEYGVKADVVVRVVNLPEAPEAADDSMETPEDTPKVIHVLSNDSDPTATGCG